MNTSAKGSVETILESLGISEEQLQGKSLVHVLVSSVRSTLTKQIEMTIDDILVRDQNESIQLLVKSYTENIHGFMQCNKDLQVLSNKIASKDFKKLDPTFQKNLKSLKKQESK